MYIYMYIYIYILQAAHGPRLIQANLVAIHFVKDVGKEGVDKKGGGEEGVTDEGKKREAGGTRSSLLWEIWRFANLRSGMTDRCA
jgi:hypothetical protein